MEICRELKCENQHSLVDQPLRIGQDMMVMSAFKPSAPPTEMVLWLLLGIESLRVTLTAWLSWLYWRECPVEGGDLAPYA
jgi:hypothetical protein